MSTPTLEAFALSIYPAGSRVVTMQSYRPRYREYPLRVGVLTPSGTAAWCVVKRGEVEGIEREARVLDALTEIGLAVPAVLAGPALVADRQGVQPTILLSELPGQPLPWLGTPTLADADLGCRLLFQGIDRLHQLTDAVAHHAVAALLPRTTLSAELDAIVRRGGDWLRVNRFAAAVGRLRGVLDRVQRPLVFSNGDYNPLNFLHDGSALSGWLDFENACFEDPLAGLASFLTLSYDEYGWGTGARVGLVERYLYAKGVSRWEFAPRLAVRCLWRLQGGVSVNDPADAVARGHMLRLLDESVADMARHQ
jgi:hypothetical protein